MKSIEVQFAGLTDQQIVSRFMTLAGLVWAYNELGSFEGRDTELNRLRREAKALRYGDLRRAKLIHDAIEATITAYRGKPIIRDDVEDLELEVAP
jgi:hypothetical protein